jgi:opacity protein-like surface antigen
MTRVFANAAAAGILLWVTSVSADINPNDISISSFNPEDAVAPSSTIEGPGIKIGEGTVLRPVFGIETGFVSNVFYEDSSEDPSGAGILRILAQIGTASLGADRMAPTATVEDSEAPAASLEYRANLRVSYDLMLSSNDTVSDVGGLGIGASLHGLTNPQGTWSFGFDDDFTRLIRAANYETSSNVNRNLNTLRLLALYHPRGRSLSGFLYYQNTVDIFERDQLPDRMSNRLGVRPQWRWLPNTQIYADLSWGVNNAIDNGDQVNKVTSYPLSLRAGLATLLSLKTTFNIDAGYTNGFYSSGPSYSAPVIGFTLGHRYSPLGRASVGYTYTNEDSVNANYYSDHVIRASFQQLLVPFVVMLQPEVHFRTYSGINTAVPGLMGPDSRNDLIFALVGGMHYNFRNWFAATANYRFSTVQTNYMYMGSGGVDDPSFARHELLFGVRAAL